MRYSYDELGILFLIYSFGGWCFESVAVSIYGRQFRNRGLTNLPFCLMYGVMGTLCAVSFTDFRSSVVRLFVGCLFLVALVQWVTGVLLERIGVGKWWDYSEIPLNISGYVALPISSIFASVIGLAVLFGNDILVGLLRFLPAMILKVVNWVMAGLIAVDMLISLISLRRAGKLPQPLTDLSRTSAKLSKRIRGRLVGYVSRRLFRAYPELNPAKNREEREALPEGALSGQMLFWLFLTGSIGGDVVEMIFMRLTRGAWVSRSSLVWGWFSLVWGLAVVLATILLHRERNRSEGYLFVMGTLLGGTYEYLCSVFTELFFGAIFWDYSKLPFNISGRVNLLYCFFWGIATVVWVRKILPPLMKLLRKLTLSPARFAMPLLAVFLLVDVFYSGVALIRYDQRRGGAEAVTPVGQYFDEMFDDERMQRIYPYAKPRKTIFRREETEHTS